MTMQMTRRLMLIGAPALPLIGLPALALAAKPIAPEIPVETNAVPALVPRVWTQREYLSFLQQEVRATLLEMYPHAASLAELPICWVPEDVRLPEGSATSRASAVMAAAGFR